MSTTDLSCADLGKCATIYYTTCDFVWGLSIQPFFQCYSSFVVMLYTHDPWISIAMMALYQLAREILLMLSVQLGLDFLRLKKEWSPGDIVFDAVSSTIGITVGMLFLWIVNPPRLIRYPTEERLRLQRDYGIKTKKFYDGKEVTFVRVKYRIQITVIQYI